jgi:sugar lactone lactonase YvrE
MAWGVSVDATSAYWSAGSTVARAALTDATLTGVGTDSATAYPIAVDGTNAYWADSVGSVSKCAVSGCSSPTTLATSPVLMGAAQGLTIDSGNVYWTNLGAGAVAMVPKGGGTPVILAGGQKSPIGIAVDATMVYWANKGDGTLMRVAITGGSPITIATGQSGPFGVAVDTSYVYWTNQTGGTVMRVVK